jgi:hypothetical protein
VTGTCECGDETYGLLKYGELLNEMTTCQLLKEDVALYPVLCYLIAVTHNCQYHTVSTILSIPCCQYHAVSTILSVSCELSLLTAPPYARCTALQISTDNVFICDVTLLTDAVLIICFRIVHPVYKIAHLA